MNRKHIALVASMILGSPAAEAAFVQYNATIASQALPFATAFTVQKFDSSLGTLTGILLSLSTNITAQIDVWSNLTSSAAFSNASASLPVTVTALSPDATTVVSAATATLASGTALPSMPGSFINSFAGLTGSASNSTSVAPLNWAYYVGLGGGTASFNATAGNGTYSGTGPFGLFFSGSGVADGTFTVRYDYDALAAVPLPAAAWLLGAGLLSFGATMRRRRQG